LGAELSDVHGLTVLIIAGYIGQSLAHIKAFSRITEKREKRKEHEGDGFHRRLTYQFLSRRQTLH
jgi:hypothetical protein